MICCHRLLKKDGLKKIKIRRTHVKDVRRSKVKMNYHIIAQNVMQTFVYNASKIKTIEKVTDLIKVKFISKWISNSQA